MTRVIGVTGRICSGKGRFSEYICKNGFVLLSYGAEVRKYVEGERGAKPTRKRLQYWGDRARIDHGTDFWDRRLLGQMDGSKDYVVDGFRYPDQVQTFQGEFGEKFTLVAVEVAEDKDRFLWCLERKRPGDPTTWRGFRSADQRDWDGYLSGRGQNTKGCFEIAGKRINNDGDLDRLERQAVILLEEGC